MNYLTIGDIKLRINLNNMNKVIQLKTSGNSEREEIITSINGEKRKEERIITRGSERKIDSAKYETIRLALEIVLSTDFELPGGDFNHVMDKLPFNVKIALNTLIAYRIIEEIK